jgi:phosphate-selective porin OprO/OprP
MIRSTSLLSVSIAAALAGVVLPASAQQLPPAELEQLVRAQAAQIQALEARLATLEAQAAGPTNPAPAAASPASTPAQEAPALAAGTNPQPTRPAPPLARRSNDDGLSPVLADFHNGAPIFTSDDGEFTFKPRGRFLLDATSTSGSRFGQRNLSATGIRRLRLGAEGTYGRFGYQLEADFASNIMEVKSAFATVAHHVGGLEAELTVGQRLSDRSMDGSTGSPVVHFMERNAVAGLIQPVRGYFGVGVTERVTGSNWHVTGSVTGDLINDTRGQDNDSLTWATRAHWTPYNTAETKLHLGGWVFYEDLAGDASPLIRSYAAAGDINEYARVRPGALPGAESSLGYGAELGVVRGRGWTFAEWGQRDIRGHDAGARYDLSHDAYAVSAGWFLTGGMPIYNARRGTWNKPSIEQDVTAGGIGAWEIKARYERADFSRLPTGGEGDTTTLGVNWYLNALARIMVEVSHWESTNRSGEFIGPDNGNTFNTRLEFIF